VYARLLSFSRRIDPRGRKRVLPWACRRLSGGAVPLGSTRLVEDCAGLLGEFGPFGRAGPVAAGLKHPVSEGDLVAGPVGLWVPSGPGRAAAVVSVGGGFDV
jgi:hypothetical protein